MARQTDRPQWQEAVQKTGSAALVAVRRPDGTRVGYRMPRTSLVEKAAAERRGTKAKRKSA